MRDEPDDDDDDDAPAPAAGSLRLDKWLWFTRVIKSRTMAAGLIESGKARVNREKVAKPSHGVKIGDVVTLVIGQRVRVLEVAALGTRRGPSTEAVLLYNDLTPPETRVPELSANSSDPAPAAPAPARDRGLGRPTKRDRRLTDRLQDRD